MNNRVWSDAEIHLLTESVKNRLDNTRIQKLLEEQGFERTINAIHCKANELQLPNETERTVMLRVAAETDDFKVSVLTDSDDEPIEELLARAKERTAKSVKRALARSYAYAQIVTDGPVGITFVSDQHISVAGATDLDRMFEDAELIRETPGIYCILGGDGIDNAIKHRQASIRSASPPSDEWRILEHYLSILGHKTLGMISGNHDGDWMRLFAGVDYLSDLARRNRIHYSPDEMVLAVELVPATDQPGQTYTIKMRHRYRYESSFNLLHAVKRMWEQGPDDFDVGVIGHKHQAAKETFDKHGLMRVGFRPGSYQIATEYTRQEGYNPAYPTCPTAVLYPEERHIVDFHNLRDAVTHLESVRAPV